MGFSRNRKPAGFSPMLEKWYYRRFMQPQILSIQFPNFGINGTVDRMGNQRN
jgi:hypothetical protein